MSYSNATFYLDYEGGSDTARADLVPTAYANNGAGLVRITCNSTAAYSTGAVFDVAGTTGSVYVGAWIVTVIDGTHVDLQGSAFTVNPVAKGTLIPRGGSSKADAWKTIPSGATSARITAGDTVRVKGSPDATSLGQSGSWSEAGPNNSTYALVSSTNATPIVVTLSAANYTLLAPVVGDTTIINGHNTNTKANGVWEISAVNGSTTITLQNADGTNSVGNGVGGATGTVRKINNLRVKLASAITKSIALVGNQGTKTNWTASANVTATITTADFREGGECLQLAMAGAFTTGLAAYFATGTLDLSAYQQVTFWIKQTAGTVAVAGDVSLRLCTDTVGAVSVHTVAVPALGALNQWVPVTVDLATNLNAAIASAALYIDTDQGAVTFLLDNIVAVKASASADSLSLISLIGKNSAGESWYGIQSINDVRIMLDGKVNSIASSSPQRGYSGTTETVTTYKRETIATTIATGSGTAVQTVQASGSAGSLISFEGGWDRTNMTTQNLETFFDGRNGFGTGLLLNNKSYVSFNKINPYRYNIGYNALTGGGNHVVTSMYAQHNSTQGLYIDQATGCTLGTIHTNSNGVWNFEIDRSQGNAVATLYSSGAGGGDGYFINSAGTTQCAGNSVGTMVVNNNGGQGLNLSGTTNSSQVAVSFNSFGTVTSKYNAVSAIKYQQAHFNKVNSLTALNNVGKTIQYSSAHDNMILGGSSSGSVSGTFAANAENNSDINYLRNFTVGEANVYTAPAAFCGSQLVFENYGGVVGDDRIFTDGAGSASAAGMRQQTAVKHGSDNYGWQYLPTSANRQAAYPLERSLVRMAVGASALVTVTRWVQRDNTGLTLRLVCKGGQLNGVASDVAAAASAAINTWEQLTVSFTPTEAGVVEIVEQTYGGTTFNGYTSDLAVSQA